MRPVSVVTTQRDPLNPTVMEVNHVSQTPEVGGREIAGHAFVQVEYLTPQMYPGVMMAVGNTKAHNNGMIRFAIGHGFQVSRVCMLDSRFGHDGTEDVVLVKPLRHSRLPTLHRA